MAFRFEKASCVVVGTFNMYILHPQWLAGHGIIEEGMEVGIETNFAQPGFRYRFPKYDATWSVAPNRIAIETGDLNMDCGKGVAGILKALPETPLFALGNNAVYQADLSELDTLSEAIREFPMLGSPIEGESVVQRTLHTAVKRTEHETTNLQISLYPDKIELACNVHTKLDNRSDSNEAAVAAAEKFLADRTYVATLARHFFGASIDHGPDNT